MLRVVEERLILSSHSVEETRRLGERLGAVLAAGDVVCLFGTLGAGKTALVQGLALGLGVPPERRVASPTFTLVNEHPGRVPLYHIDLYRIDDPGELAELGLEDYLGERGVAAIEWAERLGERRPRERLELHLHPTGEETRRIEVVAHGAGAAARLRDWKERTDA
jgi:tRNA threonylcarbamoyladenosine biosynthesis protein TsaE